MASHPRSPESRQPRHGALRASRAGRPRGAGSTRAFFTYRLDCQDRTFDRLGDVRIPRSVPKGWQPVTNDPTALAVANRFCLGPLPDGRDGLRRSLKHRLSVDD